MGKFLNLDERGLSRHDMKTIIIKEKLIIWLLKNYSQFTDKRERLKTKFLDGKNHNIYDLMSLIYQKFHDTHR